MSSFGVDWYSVAQETLHRGKNEFHVNSGGKSLEVNPERETKKKVDFCNNTMIQSRLQNPLG